MMIYFLGLFKIYSMSSEENCADDYVKNFNTLFTLISAPFRNLFLVLYGFGRENHHRLKQQFRSLCYYQPRLHGAVE